WLTTNDTNTLLDQPKLEEAIAQLSRLNFNTLYPVVWNSGYALYPSEIAKKEGIQPFVHKGLQGQDPLTDLITKAHNQGLLVLPWFEFGFMAPPTSELAIKHPKWITNKRDGSQATISAAGQVVWLNPFHPQVQKFITSLVMEVMDLYDVDGIQFDDHLSLPSELGYDDYTVNLYKQETEKDPPTNPKDPDWLKWRADKLTAYVTQLNQAIKAKKSNAIFSVSPNPYDTAYSGHLQDWLTWVRQDLIDELVVQVYRPDLDSFINQLTKPSIREARQKIPTGVGILTGLRNRQIEMEFIQEKVLTAKQYGLGVSFFFYDSLWNYAPEPVAERQKKFLALFSIPAVRKLESPKPPENIAPIDSFEPYEPLEKIEPLDTLETYKPTDDQGIIDNLEPDQPPENTIPEESFEPTEPIGNTPTGIHEPTGPIADPASLDEFKPYQPRENTPPPPVKPTVQPEPEQPYQYAEDGVPIPVSW
ncbi:MAG TPA: hypothetical protein DCF68_06740, partial [Cyanothece sp. UBA12306]|nr:hypothetical protein [Cyanothece sp. UBA12306]